jgi:hypothetical protein
MTRRLVPFVMAMVSLCGLPAAAQDSPAPDVASADPPAHISFVDGAAVLERDGQAESDPLSMPLLAGDRLRTQGGRVEVLFADGSALHLDANTLVDFQSDEVVRLLEGQIRLSIAGPSREVSYRIDAPSAWVQIVDPGEYRIAIVRDQDVELGVLRGAAELVNEQGRSYIRAGERTFARAGAAPSPPYVYNSAQWDSFDRWSEDRRAQRLGASAQYLPDTVRPYSAAFDAYGSWRHEPDYGYVWYPRVSVGWRPYHHGRWVSLRPYGWTWIASDPWGWPTHHYGRWGISGGAWFWIPGRHWGPAWVSWAYASDYVSWCPLGWNNRPVLQIVNVNYFGGRRYSPWHAWTVVPRRHFGGSHVRVTRVATVRIDDRVHRTFVVRDRAPETRVALGRSASPIRTAGRYAVPRSAVDTLRAREAGGASTPRVERGERRFPAPAREPAAGRTLERRAGTTRTGERAVARERSTGAGINTSRGVAAPEYRRSPGARTAEPGSAPVTEPREGAVRALPRARQRSAPAASATESAAPSAPRGQVDVYRAPRMRDSRESARPGPVPAPQYRVRPREDSAPSGASESPAPAFRRSAPRVSPGSEGPARPPVNRRADPGPSPRSEGAAAPAYRRSAPPAPSPRTEGAGPSFRSAPERRGPSGPPPSAAPSRSGGDRSPSASGGGRQRSGNERGGSARRRQ